MERLMKMLLKLNQALDMAVLLAWVMTAGFILAMVVGGCEAVGEDGGNPGSDEELEGTSDVIGQPCSYGINDIQTYPDDHQLWGPVWINFETDRDWDGEDPAPFLYSFSLERHENSGYYSAPDCTFGDEIEYEIPTNTDFRVRLDCSEDEGGRLGVLYFDIVTCEGGVMEHSTDWMWSFST